MVVVLRSRPVSSTAVMNEDGYESKEEESVTGGDRRQEQGGDTSNKQ